MQLGLTNSCCLQEIKPGNHRNLTLLFILLLVCRHLVHSNRIEFAIKKLCSPFITFILAPVIKPALSYSVKKSGEGWNVNGFTQLTPHSAHSTTSTGAESLTHFSVFSHSSVCLAETCQPHQMGQCGSEIENRAIFEVGLHCIGRFLVWWDLCCFTETLQRLPSRQNKV